MARQVAVALVLLVLGAAVGRAAPAGSEKVETLGDLIFADGFESGDTSAWARTATSVLVPHLVGLTQAEAEAAILAAGLIPGAISEVFRLTMRTGVVAGQDPAAGTAAAAGSAVDLVVVSEPPAGQVVPGGWAGLWRMTVGFADPDGNDSIGAVEEIDDVICPGDPFGLALVEAALPGGATWCSGLATHESLDAFCQAEIVDDDCTVNVTLELAMDRTGNTLAGAGQWTATSDCFPSLPPDGEPFVVSGVRLATHHGLCQEPVSSLLQKFMVHPLRLIELMPL